MTRVRSRAFAALCTLVAGLSAAIAFPAPASAAGESLYVEVVCVSPPLVGTSWQAHFRVLNPTASTVVVPFGADNMFSPGTPIRGQETAYAPGWTSFATTFTQAEALASWTVGDRTATADQSSTPCVDIYSGVGIGGRPAVGNVLTMAGERVQFAVYGWSETLQWFEGCDTAEPVQVGTGRTYTVHESNLGKRIGATITYSNGDHGAATSSTCGPNATVGARPAADVAPVIEGTVKVGEPLSLSSGSWTGTSPVTETVEWEVCGATCVAVGSDATYTPDADDVGKSVRATVTGTNTFGSATVSTAAVGPVPGPPAGPAVLKVNVARLDLGKATVGKTGPLRTVRITNGGASSLVVRSIGVTGKHRKDVVVTTTCPGDTLAPGASCTVTLRLKPTAAGRRTASLVVTSTAPGGSRTVALVGQGVRPKR